MTDFGKKIAIAPSDADINKKFATELTIYAVKNFNKFGDVLNKKYILSRLLYGLLNRNYGTDGWWNDNWISATYE